MHLGSKSHFFFIGKSVINGPFSSTPCLMTAGQMNLLVNWLDSSIAAQGLSRWKLQGEIAGKHGEIQMSWAAKRIAKLVYDYPLIINIAVENHGKIHSKWSESFSIAMFNYQKVMFVRQCVVAVSLPQLGFINQKRCTNLREAVVVTTELEHRKTTRNMRTC